MYVVCNVMTPWALHYSLGYDSSLLSQMSGLIRQVPLYDSPHLQYVPWEVTGVSEGEQVIHVPFSQIPAPDLIWLEQ